MNSRRVREIKLKKFSLSGQITSQKNNSIIQFESSLERDYSILLEFQPNIKCYLEQPMIINYKEGKRGRKYIPDFFVQELDSEINGRVVEVKYQKELFEKRDILKCKFEAARKFCFENNLKFEVVTENEIRTEYLKNCKFLWKYRFNNSVINWTDIDLILYLFEEKEKVTPNQIMELTKDDFKKAELLYLTWFLLSSGYVSCNMNKLINMNTILWID
ncbi:TnsA endonuclease N-terminal domain-containing protein [Tenacibaculum aestuarii]|uniref:TnsA endonuclease N-terminal domain-containing protein n=1 Tax=Tenacibaculum aestuarii TaxID=362781 RepID=UPI0038B6A8AF